MELNKNYKQSYLDGATKREHQIIMEEHIGRKLRKGEVVHHVDGNKRNNNLKNLILTTRSEHAKIHAKELDRSKPVVQMSKDFEVIKKWKSAMAASKELPVHRSNICKCCKGELQTTGGYRWKYLEGK